MLNSYFPEAEKEEQDVCSHLILYHTSKFLFLISCFWVKEKKH